MWRLFALPLAVLVLACGLAAAAASDLDHRPTKAEASAFAAAASSLGKTQLDSKLMGDALRLSRSGIISTDFDAEHHRLIREKLSATGSPHSQQQLQSSEQPPQSKCVTPLSLAFSGNLLTLWFGAHSHGHYYECDSTPGLNFCSALTLKLMCVWFEKNDSNGSSSSGASNTSTSIHYRTYDKPLLCNGVMGSFSNGLCYNKTLCPSVSNVSADLFWWGLELQNLVASRLAQFPVCYALEKLYRYPGEPDSQGIPRCHPNVSFFYVDPEYCNAHDPLDGSELKDKYSSETTAVVVCMLLLLSVSALATLVGFSRRFVVPAVAYCLAQRDHDDNGKESSPEAQSEDDQQSLQQPFVLNRDSTVVQKSGHENNNSSSVEVQPVLKQEGQEHQQQQESDQQSDSSLAKHALGFLDSFDVLSGIHELFHPVERDLPTNFFDGVRVVALTGIVVGHSLFFPFQHGGSYTNIGDVLDFVKTYEQSVLLLPFLLGVDTFFFMSAFLAFLLLMQQVERVCGGGTSTTTTTAVAPPAAAAHPTNRRPITKAIPTLVAAYFFRFIRIAPPMLIVMGVTTFLLPYAVQGPLARILIDSAETQHCKDAMWASALFIQNTNIEQYQCLSWTWFLMVDMQLFIFVPPLVALIFVWKRHFQPATTGDENSVREFIATWAPVLFVSSLIVAFFVVSVYHHPITTDFTQPDGTKVHSYFRAVDRATPYLFGILTAMLGVMPPVITWLKDKRVFYALQFFAFALGLTIWNVVWKMISHFYTNGSMDGESGLQYGGHFVYNLVGLFWMLITLCALAGHKTWFTSALEGTVFRVIGQLMFGVYLVHAIVILTVLSQSYEYISFQPLRFVTFSFGVIVISSLVALALNVLVDRPLSCFCTFVANATGTKKKKDRRPAMMRRVEQSVADLREMS